MEHPRVVRRRDDLELHPQPPEVVLDLLELGLLIQDPRLGEQGALSLGDDDDRRGFLADTGVDADPDGFALGRRPPLGQPVPLTRIHPRLFALGPDPTGETEPLPRRRRGGIPSLTKVGHSQERIGLGDQLKVARVVLRAEADLVPGEPRPPSRGDHAAPFEAPVLVCLSPQPPERAIHRRPGGGDREHPSSALRQTISEDSVQIPIAVPVELVDQRQRRLGTVLAPSLARDHLDPGTDPRHVPTEPNLAVAGLDL